MLLVSATVLREKYVDGGHVNIIDVAALVEWIFRGEVCASQYEATETLATIVSEND